MNFMRSELEEDKIIKQVDEMYVHLVDKRKTIISRLQDANKYLLKSKEDLIIIDGNSESLSELKEKFKECLESDAISQLQYEDYINDIDSIKDIDEDISKFSNYIYHSFYANFTKCIICRASIRRRSNGR